MILSKSTLLITMILSVNAVKGQNHEPLDLAKKIFSKENFQDIDKFISGEYKGSPNGRDLQKGSITKFTLLGQSQTKAVVGMNIVDSFGKGIDTYLYFVKEKWWKMYAIRTLAMTGLLKKIKDDLEQITQKQLDSIVTGSKNMSDKNMTFTSRKEYVFQLANIKLTLESDANIEKHFAENRLEFEKLKNYAMLEFDKGKKDDNRSRNLIENLKSDYQKLYITAVSTGGYELGNGIDFLIGGMVDNSVGYLFVRDKKDLPEMDPDRVIMIKELGKGWYMYKTT